MRDILSSQPNIYYSGKIPGAAPIFKGKEAKKFPFFLAYSFPGAAPHQGMSAQSMLELALQANAAAISGDPLKAVNCDKNVIPFPEYQLKALTSLIGAANSLLDLLLKDRVVNCASLEPMPMPTKQWLNGFDDLREVISRNGVAGSFYRPEPTQPKPPIDIILTCSEPMLVPTPDPLGIGLHGRINGETGTWSSLSPFCRCLSRALIINNKNVCNDAPAFPDQVVAAVVADQFRTSVAQ